MKHAFQTAAYLQWVVMGRIPSDVYKSCRILKQLAAENKAHVGRS